MFIYNKIEDLSPISFLNNCHELHTLHLDFGYNKYYIPSGNRITDFKSISSLAASSHLKSLNLNLG